MSRIYIYPKIDYSKIDSPNLYVSHLENALKSKHIIVNNYPNKIGVFDLYRNILKTDVFLFNWIEDLPSKRLGKIQCIFFIVFLLFAKVLRKKIIWVLHNKYSHNKSNNKPGSDFLFKLMLRYANLIMTHSHSGIGFVNKQFPEHALKIWYISHPVQEVLPSEFSSMDVEKEFDLFIWGTIYPYKGIVEFLQFVKHNQKFHKIRILIVGICPDPEYEKELKSYLTANIIYENKFYKIEQIAEFAAKSRFILFTYHSGSVLSSGSLMDSLRMGVPIIGPDHGAFRDLSPYYFMNTYKNYDEICEIYENVKFDKKKLIEEIRAFYAENNWNNFGEKFNKELKKIF